MGEAKRRKALDPNFGQPPFPKPSSGDVLKSACKLIRSHLSNHKEQGLGQIVMLIVFTNNECGCTDAQIKLLIDQIPQIFLGESFTLFVLHENFAGLPDDKMLEGFIPIKVGK